MSSYISTWEFLRTLEKCEKHSAATRASLCTSLVSLKIPTCLYNSTMHSDAFFISLIMKRIMIYCSLTEKCQARSKTVNQRTSANITLPKCLPILVKWSQCCSKQSFNLYNQIVNVCHTLEHSLIELICLIFFAITELASSWHVISMLNVETIYF